MNKVRKIQEEAHQTTQTRKFKNSLLFLFIFLSQIHVLFRGADFKILWILNDKIKTLNFSVFLFIVYLENIVLYYCLLRPKGVSKDLLTVLFILSILDMFHFLLFSSYGYEIDKLCVMLFVFCCYKFYKKYF
jgi:hypothetical protein